MKPKNAKLTAGKVLAAWRDYPARRKEISEFPTGKPIFVTGTHRSGTTWAAAMLAEPGIWYVHEPFNPNKKLWNRAFTYSCPKAVQAGIDEFVVALISGEYRQVSNNAGTDHQLMPLRLFKPPIRRVLIKDPIACLLTGYIAAHFDFHVIALFRHPAGFVSSVTRLGWPVGKFIKQFLADELLMAKHIGPYAGILEKHQDRDDMEAAAVLHGALNTVLWRQSRQNRDISVIRYEDLCEAPLERFEELFGKLHLPYSELTRLRHMKLCHHRSGPNETYRTHQVNRDSLATCSSWRKQLTRPEVLSLRRIWHKFEVPLYDNERDW